MIKLFNHMIYFDQIVHTHRCRHDIAQRLGQMPFVIGRGFADVKILKNVKLVIILESYEIFYSNIVYTVTVINSSLRDCSWLHVFIDRDIE